MAEKNNPNSQANWSPALREEMAAMTSTQRAAVLMLFWVKTKQLTSSSI